jgi:hypothetical protein
MHDFSLGAIQGWVMRVCDTHYFRLIQKKMQFSKLNADHRTLTRKVTLLYSQNLDIFINSIIQDILEMHVKKIGSW